jgi:hypothetical protein
MEFMSPISHDLATEMAAHRAAAVAYEKEMDWDPFNLQVLVTPIGRKYRKQLK